MARVGVVGQVSRDLVDGEARLGGPVFYATRALTAAGAELVAATKCTPREETELGGGVICLPAASVPAFSFHYDGDVRVMAVEALGEPWTPADLERLPELPEWVHVGGLSRGDFPADTLAALAGGRRLAVDAQGLARPARLGPLRLDGGFDRSLLAHVAVLKLAEEEAVAVAGAASPDAVAALGVPEALLTLGPRGAIVIAGGHVEHVDAPEAEIDPTGAGDAFLAGYAWARAEGAEPVEAARRAAEVVGAANAR
jgi:sugar/nucleoside kinase (ribokinase family)